ncbi:hypothetical protein NPIL_663491 [Nephila pilipes]|uniref:Uncharacterized protein n=1 Tax=Nephila pilipes TaxID=299642 RepID=A0A8X6T3S3_NEPPI|nr:hypothetical protein NPIL_663491 [Nephila pilipes]
MSQLRVVRRALGPQFRSAEMYGLRSRQSDTVCVLSNWAEELRLLRCSISQQYRCFLVVKKKRVDASGVVNQDSWLPKGVTYSYDTVNLAKRKDKRRTKKKYITPSGGGFRRTKTSCLE